MPDVLALLIEERDRLNLAIEALQRGVRRRGRPPGSKTKVKADATPSRRGRKKMSAAARKAASERMKKYWAARNKAKK